jgi:hypothetical protein
MLDVTLPAGPPKDVLHGRAVLFAVFELDAVAHWEEAQPLADGAPAIAGVRSRGRCGKQWQDKPLHAYFRVMFQ